MIHAFSRSELLLGTEALETLRRSRVAVFGVGGVGGYAVEALARSGVGELHLVDNDTVSLTNINRQIIALHSTVGRAKVDVMRERVLDIFEKTPAGALSYPWSRSAALCAMSTMPCSHTSSRFSKA